MDKLSQSDHEDLLRDLINALSSLKTPTEAALFVQDLLTEKELHTSHGTVAKVGAWLAQKGEGFRLIIQRLPKKQKVKDWREYSPWDKAKRLYPSYLWPDVLLEEIVRSANKKEKERLSKVLKNLGQKSSMHKKLQELIDEDYREQRSVKKKPKLKAQTLKS